AAMLGGHVRQVTFEERLRLHLAAVLVNNFTNSLFVAAWQVLQNNADQFQMLLPLIRTTIDKLDSMPPIKAQTGPAKRGDRVTMKKHLHLLEEHESIHKLYKLMSKLIVTQLKSDVEL